MSLIMRLIGFLFGSSRRVVASIFTGSMIFFLLVDGPVAVQRFLGSMESYFHSFLKAVITAAGDYLYAALTSPLLAKVLLFAVIGTILFHVFMWILGWLGGKLASG